MKARPEGEHCGQRLREHQQDVKAKSVWQRGVQGMTAVRSQENQTRDAKSSKNVRINTGTSKIRTAGGRQGIKDEWKGRPGNSLRGTILGGSLSHPLLSNHFNVLTSRL